MEEAEREVESMSGSVIFRIYEYEYEYVCESMDEYVRDMLL